MPEHYDPPKEVVEQGRRLLYHGWIEMPNGYGLFMYTDPSVNALEYWSDEIGGGVMVWQTALVDHSTLEFALKHWRQNYGPSLLRRTQHAIKRFGKWLNRYGPFNR
jgi:hypothetical protein